MWGIARFSDPAAREEVEALGRHHPRGRPRRRRLRRPADGLHVRAAPGRRLRRRLRAGAAGERRGHRVSCSSHCREREGGAGDVDPDGLQAAPRPVARVPRGRPDRRPAAADPQPYSIVEDRRGGGGPLLRPRVRPAGHDRPHGQRVRRPGRAAARGTCRPSPRGSPSSPRWDPLPYSPIHYDDINAQLEPLLDAATRAGDHRQLGRRRARHACRSGRRTSASCSASRPRSRSSRSRVPRSAPSATTPSGPRSPGPCTRRLARRLPPDGSPLTTPTAWRRVDRGALPVRRAAARARPSRESGTVRLRPRRLPRGPRGAARQPRARRRPAPRAPTHAVVGDLRRRLVNRLEVEAWYAEHPEVEDVAIRGPVDINGLPRTGTTALADMLSLDPQFRCLRGWEQTKPVPAADRSATRRSTRGAARFEEMHAARSDEQQAMHIFEIDATMEDTEVLGMAFHGQQMMLPVRGYRDWWRDADLTETYALPPPRREAPRLAAAARPVAVQGAAPQVPPRGARGGLPGHPVRHDAPRPGQGRALVRQPRRRRSCRPPTSERDLHRARAGDLRPPPDRHGARHRGARTASARTASSTSTTATSSPTRRAPSGGSTSGSASSSRPRSSRRSSTGSTRNRLGAERHPPLHGRAVRADHRPDPIRLRLLHPPLRRGGGGLTDERTSDLERPDCRAPRRRRRQPARDLAARRPHRGRGAGHEQAGAVDPGRAATSATSTPTPAGRCSCRCGTTRATRADPNPDYVYLNARDRRRRRLRDLRLPRHHAVRRDHPAAAGMLGMGIFTQPRTRPGLEPIRPHGTSTS